MRAEGNKKQTGVVLILVLLVLTLFEVVGIVVATYPTPERQCEQNPTVEVRDDRCVKEVGPTDERP